MSTNRPFLARLGANTRAAPSTINISAGPGPGPDYLGQETVDVDGHPCDRPGVTSRLPEGVDPEADDQHRDPRLSRMDTGEELPVLLTSSMSTDPCEGVQGSYTQIIEGECARCGYDRLRESVQTMADERFLTCNACGARQDARADHGYTMPTTPTERADRARKHGEIIGTIRDKDIVWNESSQFLFLVDDDETAVGYPKDVAQLFASCVEADIIDLEDFERRLDYFDRIDLLLTLLPEGLTVTKVDDEEDD